MIRLLSALSLVAAFTLQAAPAGDAWSRVASLYHQRLQQTGIVGSSLMFVKNGAVAHKAFEGYQDRATKRARRRGDDLSLGVDHQDVHRHRDHAAARSRPAVARRSGGEVRARAARGPQPVRRHLAGHDPAPDDAQRRLPRRHLAVGRRSAVASVRADPLGAGGRDDAVHRAAVPAGHASTATRTPASSFSGASSSCSPATTTRSTSTRTSSCRSA